MADSAARAMKLGWVGLGRIGLPMAQRLVSAGHDVSVWDKAPAAMELASVAGAVESADLPRVASDAEVVFLCLPSVGAVEEVVFGSLGIARTMTAGTVIVDHSTISPTTTRAFADRALEVFGLSWVDMPISGGVEAARDGQLIGWMAGAVNAIDVAAPLVAVYCDRVHKVGDAGRGQLVKACNQMIVGATVAAWSEMLALARAAGLDPVDVVEMLRGGGADSRVGMAFGGRLADGSFPPQSLANFTKDLSIIAEVGDDWEIALPLAAAALAELTRIIPAK